MLLHPSPPTPRCHQRFRRRWYPVATPFNFHDDRTDRQRMGCKYWRGCDFLQIIKIMQKTSHLDWQPPPHPTRPLRLHEPVKGVGVKPPFKLGYDLQGGEGMMGCYWGGWRLGRQIWYIVECCFLLSPPRVSNYWIHHAHHHNPGGVLVTTVVKAQGRNQY